MDQRALSRGQGIRCNNPERQVWFVRVRLGPAQGLRKLFSVAGSNMKESLELAKRIERLEEQGDDVKDNMLDEIYGSWEVLDYASYHNYIETTIEAEDILDRY